MPSVTVTNIVKEADGRVLIRFGKREREFSSLASLRQWASNVLDRETLDALAIALMLERQPALGNPSAFEGHSIAVNFANANWGTIT